VYIEAVEFRREYFPTDRYYPFNIPVLRRTARVVFRHPVTFFVGKNGSGKSTLLEALARGAGVHLWDMPRRHQASENPYETHLADFLKLIWTRRPSNISLLRAETFRELSDFLDDLAICDPGRLQYHGGHLLSQLSHGQGILTYIRGRCQSGGLFLFDEPEAALSPASQVGLLRFLYDRVRQGETQYVIVTHSPILLSLPGAQILSFDGPSIQEVRYEETEHYRIYRQLFEDPKGMLQDAWLSSEKAISDEQAAEAQPAVGVLSSAGSVP